VASLLSGVVDVYPGKRAPKKIRVTRAEILRVMGADVPDSRSKPASARSVSRLFEAIKTAARKVRFSLRGNARSLPGAPKSNEKSI